jgi:hypothetical protein
MWIGMDLYRQHKHFLSSASLAVNTTFLHIQKLLRNNIEYPFAKDHSTVQSERENKGGPNININCIHPRVNTTQRRYREYCPRR